MSDVSLYVMTPTEIVWGHVLGYDGALPRVERVVPARKALEAVLREALSRPPCGVTFSGGRDSSVVLAVATHVARRDGLPPPIPITKVFPDAPAASEGEWQEAVIRHLELDDWHRIVIHDELDLVGPLAARHLCADGVVWPPAIHVNAPALELVSGGALLDGEGGDEVLGVLAHRVAPITRVMRSPRTMRWPLLRSALGALAPKQIRAPHLRHKLEELPLQWLRPFAREALVDELTKFQAAQPLSFSSSVRMMPRRRSQVIGRRNRRIHALRYDVVQSSPLQDPRVVHALAAEGKVLGIGDRTAVLRELVPDLLPDAVLARTTKADFGAAYFARYTREFATGWSGDGVDDDLVDVGELRRLWLDGVSVPPTSALLQAAWLATSLPPNARNRG